MARKTTGTTTGTTATTRKKKAVTAAAPVITAAAEETRKTVHDIRLEDEIRQRAYEIYLERNGSSGDPHQDWLTAEREILARH